MNLDEIAILEWHIPDLKLESFLKSVITRIPAEYVDSSPSFSVVQGPSKWGAHVEPGDNLVTLDAARLTTESEQVAVGTVAHELAHVFLCHSATGGLADEHAADELTRQWGFSEEIHAMRHIYPLSTMK